MTTEGASGMTGDDDIVPVLSAEISEAQMRRLAQSFAAVVAPSFDAATEMFTLVGLIVFDMGDGESEDGEYWPDAQKVTFTEPEPDPEPVPPMLARRGRLQDWLDRSGEVLEVDGSGYTRGGASGATGEPPSWHIATGPPTVRLYPGPPEDDR